MRLLTLFFVLLASQATADHHYTVQSTGTPYTLRSITFINENTGFVAGNSTTLFRTSNGGNNWISIDLSSPNTNYNCVAFANSLTGFVVSDSSELIKTTNGGLNWQITTLGANPLKHVYFLNETMGFVSGANGTLFKTTNRGINWTNVSLNIPETISKIVFRDSSYGYFLTRTTFLDSGSVYKTTNGGESWQRENNFFAGYTGNRTLYDCIPLNRDTVYVSLGYYQTGIMRTTNGGQSWQYIYNHFQTGGFPGSFYEIFFKDGYLYAFNGATDAVSCYMVRSSNGGFNFSHHTAYQLFGAMLDLFIFKNSSVGYICGESGYIGKLHSYTTNIKTQSEINVSSGYVISPNPAGNILKVTSSSIREAPNNNVSLKIFDVAGREVNSFILNNSENTLNISSLPRGIYFISISADGKESFYKKFLKAY